MTPRWGSCKPSALSPMDSISQCLRETAGGFAEMFGVVLKLKQGWGWGTTVPCLWSLMSSSGRRDKAPIPRTVTCPKQWPLPPLILPLLSFPAPCSPTPPQLHTDIVTFPFLVHIHSFIQNIFTELQTQEKETAKSALFMRLIPLGVRAKEVNLVTAPSL